MACTTAGVCAGTTDSRHGHRRHPNLVKDPDIVRPDQVWVAGITAIRLLSGEVYLAILEGASLWLAGDHTRRL